MTSNPAAAGTQPISTAPSSQSADKYSAIADLESVFSSTSISSGFGFPAAGVSWSAGGVVGGGGAAMWGPQTMMYNNDGTNQMPQMFTVNSASNATVAPPSYSAVAGYLLISLIAIYLYGGNVYESCVKNCMSHGSDT